MTELNLSATTRLTVRTATPEALEVEARYAAGSPRPPLHLHPEQDEHFTILAGAMTTLIGDKERAYSAGESLTVPRGTPHTMWNAGEAEARVTWRTEPALDTIGWFEALDAAHRTGDYEALGATARAHAREIQFV
jgi:mannose-6-phosphate isomerase-like protein (cupin superfamily)